MKNRIESIIRYLNHEMSKKEKLAFEHKMNHDEALEKEVAFQKGLRGFGKRQNPELESKLTKLGDEFFLKQPAPKTNSFKPVGFAALIILFFAGIYILYQKNHSTEIKENLIDEIPTNTELKKDSLTTPFIPPTPLNQPTKTIPETQQKQNNPIAEADLSIFQPNPFLENLIQDEYRGKSSIKSTNLKSPAPDAVFQFASKIPFVISGNSKRKPNYELIIYNNQTEDIENDVRVFETILKGKDNGESFDFQLKKPLTLEKGLFYLIIKTQENGEILHLSRFSVK